MASGHKPHILHIHIQHIGIHSHRTAFRHRLRLCNYRVKGRYAHHRLCMDSGIGLTPPHARIFEDREQEADAQYRSTVHRQPCTLRIFDKLLHADAVQSRSSMRPCDILVNSNSAGSTCSPGRQTLDSIEPDRHWIVSGNDSRAAAWQGRGPSRRMEGHFPSYRRIVSNRIHNPGRLTSENAKRQRRFHQVTSRSSQNTGTRRHLPAYSHNNHGSLHLVQLHRAVPRTGSRDVKHIDYNSPLHLRHRGNHRKLFLREIL